MSLATDQCLCLRKVEYSETSQILTLFGREKGIVKVLAKGAHRRTKAGASRFDGGIDLLEVGFATFTDDPKRDLATLTEWKLIDGHLALRRSLRGLRLGLYAAELVSLLLEPHDPHPALFDRLVRTIPELGTDRVEEVMLACELDVLKQTGYLPELAVCVVCRRKPGERERVYFSPARGGMVCRDCQEQAPDRITADARLLRLAQSILVLPRSGGAAQRLPRLTTAQSDPVNRLLAEHVTYVLGKRLKTRRYLNASRAIARKD